MGGLLLLCWLGPRSACWRLAAHTQTTHETQQGASRREAEANVIAGQQLSRSIDSRKGQRGVRARASVMLKVATFLLVALASRGERGSTIAVSLQSSSLVSLTSFALSRALFSSCRAVVFTVDATASEVRETHPAQSRGSGSARWLAYPPVWAPWSPARAGWVPHNVPNRSCALAVHHRAAPPRAGWSPAHTQAAGDSDGQAGAGQRRALHPHAGAEAAPADAGRQQVCDRGQGR